jgi:molecular chaperone GrpE (heat shock protein)
VGAPFDPVVHEAVAEVPVDDPAADGTVMAVVSEGWTMGKRTVRAGRVVTGRHGPQAEG